MKLATATIRRGSQPLARHAARGDRVRPLFANCRKPTARRRPAKSPRHVTQAVDGPLISRRESPAAQTPSPGRSVAHLPGAPSRTRRLSRRRRLPGPRSGKPLQPLQPASTAAPVVHWNRHRALIPTLSRRPRHAHRTLAMYEQRALVLFNELRGHSVGGWQIRDLIRHGKSAAVFIAHQPPRTAALKIFDPELVARYGVLTQLTRINRELSLRERHHPNLVEIYDGGQCPDTGYHFLVMQYLTGDPLSIHIPTLPRTRIPALLQQMASAAKFLEDNNLVHRDIKPDNVVIHGSTGDATLLDLGVLRPIIPIPQQPMTMRLITLLAHCSTVRRSSFSAKKRTPLKAGGP